MKTRTTFFVVLLSALMLVSCGHEKAATGSSSKGFRNMFGLFHKNQPDIRKMASFAETNAAQKEVAAPAFEKIVYAKSKKQIKLEKKAATKARKAMAKAEKAGESTKSLKKQPKEVAQAEAPHTYDPKRDGAVVNVHSIVPDVPIMPIVQTTPASANNINMDSLLKKSTEDNEQPDVVIPTANIHIPFSIAEANKYTKPYVQLKKYNVVVGSFDTLKKAYDKLMDMKDLSYNPFISKKVGTNIYRVIIGSYNDKDEADIDGLGLELDSIEYWIMTK
jgi:Sporulation related domain.